MTRDEVFRRLVTLGVGLNVTFVLWGVLQVSPRGHVLLVVSPAGVVRCLSVFVVGRCSCWNCCWCSVAACFADLLSALWYVCVPGDTSADMGLSSFA